MRCRALRFPALNPGGVAQPRDMKPPLPSNELRRLEVLWETDLLDTAPESEMDDIAALAAQICDTPIALISLVDEHRQWFKARQGFDATETRREDAICAYAILGHELFQVSDLSCDVRFRQNALVTGHPQVRFYAGMPLMTRGGHALGTLCVMDQRPRTLTEPQEEGLRALARLTMQWIERRRAAKAVHRAESDAPSSAVAPSWRATTASEIATEQTERFERILQNIEEGIYIWQLERPGDASSFRLLYANAASTRLTRIPAETVVGKQIQEAFPTMLETEMPRRFLEVVTSGAAQTIADFHFVDPRAPKADFVIRLYPMTNQCVEVIFENVTDRRLAQEAQLEGQARKSAILDSALDAIVTIDHEGRVFEWNRAAEGIFGYRRSEMLGRELADAVFPAATQERFRDGLIRFLEQGKSELFGSRVELTARRVDGSEFPIEMSFMRVPREGGPILTGFLRDITERKEFEEALRSSEEHFRSLIENSSDVIAIVDAQGRFSYLSHTVRRILSYEPEDLINHSAFEIIHPNDLPSARRELARVLGAPNTSSTTQIRCRHANGTWHLLEVVGMLRAGVNGQPTVVVNARDITERRHLEEQLRQAQKMESVGQLAGGVAHDFNNILTVIQGHASLLGADGEFGDRQRSSVQQIVLATERAANLTRQLLAFSRKQVLQQRHLDLNGVVHSMSKMLQRLLGEDVSLHVHFGKQLPAIHADQGMIEQVLMNLAVNSRDAMPHGGQLILNTAAVELLEDQPLPHPDALPGQYVLLSVGDTGTGIAPESLPHIFEPFFTTKDVGKGTGLGLATVYGIVRQHLGWVSVNSEVGRGTLFQIWLPASQEVPDDISENAFIPLSDGGKETILVVEDEPALRLLVRSILERAGYRVLEAESGVAALELWEERGVGIDLVVTDMVMPDGLSGRELGQRLLQEKPSLKVIYSSGYSPDVIGEEFLQKENNHFLQKPYHPNKLIELVRHCLDKSRT
jgi:PAS domain S-box-containing protein